MIHIKHGGQNTDQNLLAKLISCVALKAESCDRVFQSTFNYTISTGVLNTDDQSID